MPIQFVAGDLFANRYAAQALAHGCNCAGSMGAGIAVGFRERYPEMYEHYRAKCKATPREFNLGDAWLWKEKGKPCVFNLATQEKYWRARASYEAIATALENMKTIADAESVQSVAMPRIGVGFGGLSWKKVRAIVEKVLGDWPGRLIVYEDFVPETPDDANALATQRISPQTRVSKAPKRPKFQTKAITIACTDVERSVSFYRDVLGAVPLPRDNGTGWWFKLGKQPITLLPNASTPSPAEFPMHAMTMLWLEVPDLSLAQAWLARHSVTVVDPGEGEFMQIADPDGLLIEVWELEDE